MLQRKQLIKICTFFDSRWGKICSDADRAKVYEKVFFQDGHRQDKYFDGSILNGAVSVVKVALYEFRNNLELNSLIDVAVMSTAE